MTGRPSKYSIMRANLARAQAYSAAKRKENFDAVVAGLMGGIRDAASYEQSVKITKVYDRSPAATPDLRAAVKPYQDLVDAYRAKADLAAKRALASAGYAAPQSPPLPTYEAGVRAADLSTGAPPCPSTPTSP